VVVPVKPLAVAKSRLSAFGDDARQELALAFASDVVTVAMRVARVLVVTDDPRAAAVLRDLGADVIADQPDAGLNPALEHGVALLRATENGGVAALSADVPALREGDLRDVLARTVGGRGFVSDLRGEGTTLLAADAGHALHAQFGPSSRQAHLGSGAHELVASRRLRCDVDTPLDLLTALALGVGPRTTATAETLGHRVFQATTEEWGQDDGGLVRLDDGSTAALPADALSHTGLRFLRPGQRVRVAMSADAVRAALP
jgi:2-phospho-L-lactate guanylyltransferase